jgi:PIN domain nuclease of toxin-antitoxin system
MRLLLDTHVLIWAAMGTLNDRAHELIRNRDNELWFSPVSIWEIVIKRARHPDQIKLDPFMFRQKLYEHRYLELPVEADHALAVASLPGIHQDPFDRMLVAQANAEQMVLVTADATVLAYPGAIIDVR